MTVFLADDSRPVRERLASMLREMPGIRVVGEAEDCIAAERLIRALRPDAAILDIRMPGGSGIEVLRRVKRASPSTLVVMLTNYAQNPYRETCLAAGADFVLDKSTDFEKIASALASWSEPS
jgi:DNA-binding NarL/FixJ family response regulator